MERRKGTDECRNIGQCIRTSRTNLKIGRVCKEQTSLPGNMLQSSGFTMVETQALVGQQVFDAFTET